MCSLLLLLEFLLLVLPLLLRIVSGDGISFVVGGRGFLLL
jgi:hypothetical protein